MSFAKDSVKRSQLLPFAFGPPPENSGLVGRAVCVAAWCFPLESRHAGVAGCAVRARNTWETRDANA